MQIKKYNKHSLQYLIFKVFAWLFLISSILLGIYARFVGLGQWPLAEDEYYFTAATLKTLETGLPLFDCGGYYVRGILLQFASLIPLKIFDSVEFSVRLIPAISSILSAIPVFLIAKRFDSKLVGFIAVIFFMLSIWEIEFARFARMYSPFQLLFLFYIYFLLRTLDDNNKKCILYLFVISAISIFVYEGAIFLLVLNYIPYIFKSVKIHLLDIVGLILLPFIYLKYTLIDFRRSDVENQLMNNSMSVQDGVAEYISSTNDQTVINADQKLEPLADIASKLPIQIPEFMVEQLILNPIWQFGLVVMMVFASYKIFKVAKISDHNFLLYAVCSLLLLSALFHMFFLWLCVVVMLFLLHKFIFSNEKSPIISILENRPLIHLILITMLMNLGWMIIYYLSVQSLTEFPNYFLKYPDFYYKVVRLWVEAMPIQTFAILFVISMTCFWSLFKKENLDRRINMFLGLLLILFLAVSILSTTYAQLKYTFFLYPLMLIIFSASLNYLVKSIVINKNIQIAILLFLVSGSLYVFEDFNYRHLVNVDTAEVNFREMYKWPKIMQYYPRKDYRTPGEFINRNIKDGEIVLSVYVPIVAHYLDRLDYMFWDKTDEEFSGLSACNGKNEFWTNAKLISEKEKLYSYLENNNGIWVINFAEKRRAKDKEIEQYIREKYKHSYVYTNLDETINVYYIDNNRTK